MRLLLTAALAFALAAGTALAAKPTRTVVELDDPTFEAEIAAFLGAACGADVVADAEGHVIVLVFTDRDGAFVRELNVFNTRVRFRNADTGATYRLLDVGPDVYWIDRETGHLVLALTGRSLTGSGVIGRVVVDLDTGEVLSVAGNDQGDWAEDACAALT